MTPSPTTVVLSPHPDDAVLCCGATIARLVRDGEKVIIVTLFDGDPPDDCSDFAAGLHRKWRLAAPLGQVRRQEDERAARVLGAELFHGMRPDAIYRQADGGNWLYDSEERLFGMRRPEDDGLLDDLTAEWTRESDADSCFLAPAAFGGHVDHVIAHELGWRLVEAGFDVAFYEDLPYAANPKYHANRLPQLLGLKPVFRPARRRDVRRKLEALGCYESQLKMLFGSKRAMSQFVWSQNRKGHWFAPVGETFWEIANRDAERRARAVDLAGLRRMG